jgi:hypothetical protein
VCQLYDLTEKEITILQINKKLKDMITIKKFMVEYPNSYKAYVSLGIEYSSINSAVDALLFNFGLGFQVLPIFHETLDKILGFNSKIKVYPMNKFNLDCGDIVVIEDYKKFKSREKAEKETLICALNFLERKLSHYNYESNPLK